MAFSYETDFYAWATEQAALLRQRAFAGIDVEEIAEEIEGMARHEKRRLDHRMIQLTMHLLKWRYQPERRGNSWLKSIAFQRRDIKHELAKMPCLRHEMNDDWLAHIWIQAANKAEAETHLTELPIDPLWRIEDILDDSYFPD